MPASRPPRPQKPVPERNARKLFERKPAARKPINQKSPLAAKNKLQKKKTRKPSKNRPNGPRIACVSVPLFPLAARLRCEPELFHEGVAIFEGNGHLARVVAATRRARKAGVRVGMTLTQARARMPKLVARARDTECERTAQEVLLEVADRFTPRVQDEEPGCVYLDLSGLERQWRKGARKGGRKRSKKTSSAGAQGPRSQKRKEETGTDQEADDEIEIEIDPAYSHEVELGREIFRQIEAAGLPARIGIAGSKLAARVASGLPRTPHSGQSPSSLQARPRTAVLAAGVATGGPVVVPSGEEASFLAPLPLYRLAPESEIADTLNRWGIESIGDFAKLPTAEVASRLGETGRRLHATARGLDPRPLTARQIAPTFREGMTLEWPIVNLEPFLFIARSALERLCNRLETRGLGCKRLEISLTLEPDGYHERAIELPSPTREVKTLLTLLRLDLEAHTPGAPVTAFSLVGHPDAPRLAQLSLLGPASLSPDRLATTIARLFALLGPGRVGSPRTEDGHRPERFCLVEYTPPPPPKIRPPLEPGHGLLAVRVLRPPVPLEVLTDEEDEETESAPGEAKAHVQRPVLATMGAPGATGSPGGLSTKPRVDNGIAPGTVAEKVGPYTVDRQPGLFRRCHRSQPRPLEIRSEIQADGDKKLQIQGAIRVASGPWELEERWWREDRTRRDYWDIELSDGSLYRIYHEREKDQWFADGVYD